MLITRLGMKGFSIIELMIVVVMVGVLLALAVPGFGNWLANSRVRTAAEELQNGLRAAQAEAVNRNRQVAFVLTNAVPARNATPVSNGSGWYIQVLPLTVDEAADASFQADSFVRGGRFSNQQSGITVSGTATGLVCFNAVGRIVNTPAAANGLGADCVAPAVAPQLVSFNIASPTRPMRVELSLGGRVRMCDPNTATQPSACTP